MPIGFGGAGVLQGGVLSRILFIVNEGLLRRGTWTALVLALVYGIFMGRAVDRPLLSALEGGEGLLGRPRGRGIHHGGVGGRLDEAAVTGVLRVVVGDDNFWELLSPQWNTGKLCADAAESSTQDPLGFFVVVVFVLTEAAAAQHREQHNE